MNFVQSTVERRVQQARADGLFDNLAGAGKPIPDLDRHRPPGWWATRLVRTERDKARALELDEQLRAAMPGLWRLDTEAEVRARVRSLNELIAAYNRVSSLAPHRKLDAWHMLDTWRRLRV